MVTVIIVVILVVCVFFAARRAVKQLRGQGSGCCGGGSSVPAADKVLAGPKLGEKTVYITGMHCDHCKNSVENAVNKIEGAVCKVNLAKDIAVVSFDREIREEDIKSAVEEAGFQVTKIE